MDRRFRRICTGPLSLNEAEIAEYFMGWFARHFQHRCVILGKESGLQFPHLFSMQ